MKVLVFDIWGNYGHFRKFYTTSSPLTFSFPPPSTIAGILGAIYGVGKDEYLEVFSSNKCSFTVKIIAPVKKVRMGINLINTKDGHWTLYGDKNHEPRTQIRTEFLKDPSFRIYVTHRNEEILMKLALLIKKHESVYTISLGLSELLADFKFMGIYESEKVLSDSAIEIVTPIVSSILAFGGLEVETGKKYFKEKLPLAMNSGRVVNKYDDVIFEVQGKTIKAIVDGYYALENGENITFF